ncbi:MAG: PAS domain-containing protein [Planctomycetes bacterium]|nr:PAS domain-containing protein [Planctomycetota bacterium]
MNGCKKSDEVSSHFGQVAMYTCKPSGDYPATFVSDSIKSRLGYEPHEFTEDSRFWADRIHPEDAPRVFAKLRQLFEHGYHTHEYRFLHKNGTYRRIHDEMRLVRNGAGRPLEIVGYWTDITEHKGAEERLRVISKVFTEATDAIFIEDLNKNIIDVNAEAERAYGWSQEELLGKGIDIIIPQERQKVQLALRPLCLQGKDVRSIECLRHSKSGKKLNVLLTLSLLTDETGHPIAIATIAKEIAKRKQVEEII